MRYIFATLIVLLLAGCFEAAEDNQITFPEETEPTHEVDLSTSEHDGETDAGTPERDAEADSDALTPEPDAEAEAVTPERDTEADSTTPEPDAEADADTVTPERDAEADADTVTPEPDAEADADTMTPEPDAEIEADTVTPEQDAEADAAEPESEPWPEFEPHPRCPPEMAFLPADPTLGVSDDVCIDRFEASRDDATEMSHGTDERIARSRADVLPWFANPITLEHLAVFEAACAAADKRLCRKAEWYSACTGPERRRYVFGDTFDATRCNSVDACCPGFCAELGIADCDTASNCGYRYSCYTEQPTGQFPHCRNATGALDVNGNLWEVVRSAEDPRGFEVRGGAFNCASPAARLACSYNATWTSLYAGFRCCRDPLP